MNSSTTFTMKKKRNKLIKTVWKSFPQGIFTSKQKFSLSQNSPIFHCYRPLPSTNVQHICLMLMKGSIEVEVDYDSLRGGEREREKKSKVMNTIRGFTALEGFKDFYVPHARWRPFCKKRTFSKIWLTLPQNKIFQV